MKTTLISYISEISGKLADVGLVVLLLSLSFSSYSQMTIGLFLNDSVAYDGYTLYAPISSRDTYLIDNCGYLINSWRGGARPAESVYLLENGNLLRTTKVATTTFTSGGTGGAVEMYDWDGLLVWNFIYSSSSYQQHHDVAYLPNGNVLILAWEQISNSNALAQGRNPAILTGGGIWPEHIIEVEPTGLTTGNIVWEWHLWDHLIQDFDSTKANYDVVANHPELVDLNFANTPSADWIHANGIDYNPELDQILINSRSFSEFWVIDHSTTSAEAASHSGGNSGKGGDLLYRWGNPQTYQRGTAADRKAYVQHNANWVPAGHPDEGKIIFFNNGDDRPGGDYSSADIIDPPVDAFGNYSIAPGAAYGPDTLYWTYDGASIGGFYSSNLAGAEQLPNGNVLICSANEGRFFEVDMDGNLHWDYICPVNSNPITQGSTPFANRAFRSPRYSPDYAAFIGRDLTPGTPVEASPIPYACNLYPAAPANCDAPLGLTAAILDPTNVDLSWDAAANDFKYQLQGRIAGSGGGFAARVVSVNSKLISGLAPGESYEWKVRKLCIDSSISAFSSLEAFTMPTSLMAKLAFENGYSAIFNGDALSIGGHSFEKVQLIDLSGRTIWQQTGHWESNAEFTSLEYGDLNKGIYLLEVQGIDGYWSKKMLID